MNELPLTREERWLQAILIELKAIRKAVEGDTPPPPSIKEDGFECSKCGKVLTSNAGRASHERFCKKGA